MNRSYGMAGGGRGRAECVYIPARNVHLNFYSRNALRPFLRALYFFDPIVLVKRQKSVLNGILLCFRGIL